MQMKQYVQTQFNTKLMGFYKSDFYMLIMQFLETVYKIIHEKLSLPIKGF